MDHGAAHERIEELILEPGDLLAFQASNLPEDIALREHLSGCPACAAELDGWRRLQGAVAEAIADDRAAAAAVIQPITPPDNLREQVLGAVRARPGAGSAPLSLGPRARAARSLAWLGLAAALVVAVGMSVLAIDQANRRAVAEADARELASALAVVDRILATNHKVVELRDTSGEGAGTISWSRHDWVVLTNALPAPPSGQEYLCWLETDGRSVLIGHMDFAAQTAYWVASLDEWQTWELGPTTRFVVSLEPAGSTQRSGPVSLEAELGS